MADGGLRCDGITVCPGGTPVLRRLSLQVPAGRRTVLVGPSGAGKTTLLRAVAGLERLQEGQIELAGRPVHGMPSHRRRVAVVFQEPRLLPHLDVIDNVAFPLRAAGMGRRTRRARAAELLDEVGLAGVAGRAVKGLSGGEQQRVALARALCAEPDLLMLDEPLASLDPNRRESLRRLIVALQQERNLTTLLVTHDRAEAAELGERVALMLEGTIVQHDAPHVLFEQPSSAAVARFFGANLLRGHVSGGQLDLGSVRIPAPGPDGNATLAIRPERVQPSADSPLRMQVGEAVYVGTHVRLRLTGADLRLEAHVPPAQAPAAGTTVGVDLPAEWLWRIPDAASPAEHAAAAPSGADGAPPEE